MSKKSGPSYANVTIAPKSRSAVASVITAPAEMVPARKLMRDDAAPVTLYLHPQARKALKRYAMENDVKVHDLMLEAMEAWFESHGLSGPVRVQPDTGH